MRSGRSDISRHAETTQLDLTDLAGIHCRLCCPNLGLACRFDLALLELSCRISGFIAAGTSQLDSWSTDHY